MDFVYCNRFFSSFVIFLCLFAYSIRIAECANNYVSKKPTRSKSQIQAAPRNDTCIWYGQCAIVEGSPKNCLYNGPPKPFNNPDADTLFKQLCPSMLSPDGSVPNTCCDTAQLNNFKDSSAVALSLLERCPSCLRNFMTLFCESTCSPIQSQFMYPASVHIGNATSPSYIEAIGVIFDTHYMDKVFNSCKEVQNPSSNGIAMDILCGQSVSSCTPQAWLDFMATQAPLTINYTIATGTVYNASGSTFDPLDTKAYSCAEAPDLASSACSCSDCTPQCPVPVPPPPPASPCVILGVDCAWAICIFIFCGLSTLFIAFLGHQWLSQNAGSSTSSLRKDSPTRSLDDVDYVMALGGSVSKFEEAGARFDDILQKLFYRWGSFCARNPIIVLLATVVLLVACCLGWLFFSVTTDPVQLWSSPYSRARTEKNFFDSHFGRFYRVEQIIIRPKDQRPVFNPLGFNCSVDPNCLNPASNFTYGPIFRKEFLQEVFGIEHHLLHLVTNSSVSLDKICLKPLEPQNQNCAVMSVSQYFQGDVANLDIVAMDVDDITSLSTYIDHIMSCATNPISVMSSRVAIPCLGAAGAPSNPWVVFGGFEGDQYARADVYANATALIITFPVKNPLDPTKTAEAMEWEDAAIAYLKDYKQENVTFTFMFERSIEDEIRRESNADVFTVISSYVVMFIYITLTLGQYGNWKRCLIDSKITLGLAGVLIVFASFGASVGLFSYVGFPATLIIIEVIPFLVLAVGVDNIFILVQTYQRDTRDSKESVEDQVARVVGKVGPSILLTSLSETCCFFIGALSTMPAVKIFSLYAALAVFIDFLLQISCFVSLMTLDIKRQESSRLDFLCFIKGPRKAVDNSPGLLYRLVSRYYSPFITHKVVRAVVLLTFTGWLLSSVAVINKISVGFDQKNSMPEKSYVLDYMKDMEEYLAVGAPVYFVVEEGLNYSVPADQNHICSRAGCDSDSLLQQIYAAARSPEYTKIAQPAGSWLDDYLSWLAPGQQKPCCQVFKNDTTLFCPSSQTDREALCQSCNASFAQQRPVEQDFMKFLPFFLIDNPGVDCPKGGHAAYASGVEVIRNRSVGASHFMTYHTVCKTSSEFTEALVQAHKVADNVSQTLGVRVFPYSVFYVYYEQYLTVVKETVENLSFSLVAIFAVTFILLGLDWYSAIVVVGTIAMIEIDLMAVMHWWGIELNAISLVNLVMGVGISVEFCSHLVRAFAVSVQGGRIGRAQDAVTHMGSSVLSGITLTKFGGILILGFSHSQIFKVYYFRMYLSIVLIGAAHGLIFLPVLLTYIGPPVNKKRLRDHREHMFSGDHRVGTPSGHDEITGEGFENPVV